MEKNKKYSQDKDIDNAIFHLNKPNHSKRETKRKEKQQKRTRPAIIES
jgi:hypothetical protein